MNEVLIPYVMINGAYSIPDDVMADVFNRMKEHHLVEKVFYRGEIKTPEEWLEVIKKKVNVVHTIWNPDTHECLMVAWLNNFETNSAFAHFCILPGGWGSKSVQLGHMCLKYWFDFKNTDGNRLLDVIVGKTPANNRAATIYLRKVGMTVLGTIPMLDYDVYDGGKIGSVFSYITEEDFSNVISGRISEHSQSAVG